MQIEEGQNRRNAEETTYKGSPLAISRLLILQGLDAPFPTFEELNRMDTIQMKQIQRDNTKTTSSLSYFNLSDKRPELGHSSHQVPPLKLHYSLRGLVGAPPSSNSQMLDLTIEKKCSPESLSDFSLIFGSDTNDTEDFDSDDDQEKASVEVVFDSTPSSNQQAGEFNSLM